MADALLQRCPAFGSSRTRLKGRHMNLLPLRAFLIRHSIWVKVLAGCYIGVLLILAIHSSALLVSLGLILGFVLLSIALVMQLTEEKP